VSEQASGSTTSPTPIHADRQENTMVAPSPEMTAEPSVVSPGRRRPSSGGSIGRGNVAAVLARTAPLIAFVVLLVLTYILSPYFFQLGNLTNVGRQAAITGVVAIGVTFVILGGGIDLSVGSVLAVVGVSSAMMVDSGLNPVLVLLLGLLIGLVFGIFNGLGVSFLKIQPFIMTLATLVIASGLALRISEGGPQPFTTTNGFWAFLGNKSVAGVPGPLIVFLVTAAIAWVVLRYTSFGRQVYAVGGNADVARLSGVRVDRIRIATYAISGVTAALAGLMIAARLRVGAPTAGNQMELDAIAAVVIGGTSLLGGVGGVGGSVLGAVLLAVLANVLNLVGVDAFDQQIVRGVIIVAAVVITATALHMRRVKAGAR
jgi:ribose transport system permease protein